jgi:hypothetical protein
MTLTQACTVYQRVAPTAKVDTARRTLALVGKARPNVRGGRAAGVPQRIAAPVAPWGAQARLALPAAFTSDPVMEV